MRRFVEGIDRERATLFPKYLEDWIDEDINCPLVWTDTPMSGYVVMGVWCCVRFLAISLSGTSSSTRLVRVERMISAFAPARPEPLNVARRRAAFPATAEIRETAPHGALASGLQLRNRTFSKRLKNRCSPPARANIGTKTAAT